MANADGTAATLLRLLADVESLLKRPELGMELAKRGVNTSVALIAAQGLSAYVDGNKRRAADDLSTAAEEIRSRMAL